MRNTVVETGKWSVQSVQCVQIKATGFEMTTAQGTVWPPNQSSQLAPGESRTHTSMYTLTSMTPAAAVRTLFFWSPAMVWMLFWTSDPTYWQQLFCLFPASLLHFWPFKYSSLFYWKIVCYSKTWFELHVLIWCNEKQTSIINHKVILYTWKKRIHMGILDDLFGIHKHNETDL